MQSSKLNNLLKNCVLNHQLSNLKLLQMKYKIILLIIILLQFSKVFSQKNENDSTDFDFTIYCYVSHTLALTTFKFLITPNFDLYYQRDGIIKTPVYHTKISKKEYENFILKDSIYTIDFYKTEQIVVRDHCEGIDDSSSGQILIKSGGKTYCIYGKCIIPSDFPILIKYLDKKNPRKEHDLKSWEIVTDSDFKFPELPNLF